jgi:hypothetical protein
MIAAGGKPLRISGNASFALLETSVKSHRIARPKPKPKASPCTSAIVIKADARNTDTCDLIRRPPAPLNRSCTTRWHWPAKLQHRHIHLARHTGNLDRTGLPLLEATRSCSLATQESAWTALIANGAESSLAKRVSGTGAESTVHCGASVIGIVPSCGIKHRGSPLVGLDPNIVFPKWPQSLQGSKH